MESCEICKKEYELSRDEKGSPQLIHPMLFGMEWAVCSMDCYKRWVQGRALFKTIHTMKEMQAWSFDKMQSVFNYGTAGEYAKEKHAMLQMSPFLFLCKLDKGNLQKLADAIGF